MLDVYTTEQLKFVLHRMMNSVDQLTIEEYKGIDIVRYELERRATSEAVVKLIDYIIGQEDDGA